MSKFLISMLLLFISFCLMLIFFIFSNTSPSPKPLSVYADDLELVVGEKYYNFYKVTNQDADISFATDCSGIIEVNQNYIEAIKPGTVKVTIYANLENETSHSCFVVKVTYNDYKFKITPYENCFYSENILYFYNEHCQFSISIIDIYGSFVENVSYQIISTSGTAKQEFNVCVLSSKQDCNLIVICKEIDFIFIINCVCI